MDHGIDDATSLVGMLELVVRAQVFRDGEWWLAVETWPGPRWCPVLDLDRHRLLDVAAGRSRDVLADWLTDAGPPGATRSHSPRSIPLPATGLRSSSTSRTKRWSWTTSTPSSSPTRRSTTSAAASRTTPRPSRPQARSALPRRAPCSSPASTGSPTTASPGCSTCSPPATPTAKSAPPILAKELLREVYAAHDLAHARRRLVVFFQHCADADVAELTRLARTIDRWPTEVLAYHHTGQSVERTRRERPHARREDPPQRPRLHQPPPLPTPTHRTTRHQMDYRPNPQNPRPSTTLSRVEPD